MADTERILTYTIKRPESLDDAKKQARGLVREAGYTPKFHSQAEWIHNQFDEDDAKVFTMADLTKEFDPDNLGDV